MTRTSITRPLVLLIAAAAAAQSPSPGNRLFQGVFFNDTRMMDLAGNIVHTWPGTVPALCAHLDHDGTLLRTLRTVSFPATGATGKIERRAFDGSLLWDFTLDGPTYFLHHDFVVKPNGNVLAIAWHLKTAAEAIAAGRDPALLGSGDFYPDAIVELQQTGPTTASIVWEWRVWDHLVQDFDPLQANFGVVANEIGRVDVNSPAAVLTDGDWNHCNGIDYDPIHEWVMISARQQNEIWVIDQSTTTAEAAGSTGGRWGKGGELLYRWGNPETYRAGGPADRTLGGQHDPKFIPPGLPGAGNVTLFNNLVPGAPTMSAVFEIVLPLDAAGNFVLDPSGRYGPTAPVWSFSASTFFSSGFVSSAQRLANGNTLVCSGGQSLLFEVEPAGTVVWTQTQVLGAPVFQCDYVERTLWASTDELSIASGGSVRFDILFGSANGSHLDLLLGSVSGTLPGTPVAGVLLPINADFLTAAMVSGFVPAFQGLFSGLSGALDGYGGGNAALALPGMLIPPALAGTTLDFAVLVADTGLNPMRASNSVSIRLVP